MQKLELWWTSRRTLNLNVWARSLFKNVWTLPIGRTLEDDSLATRCLTQNCYLIDRIFIRPKYDQNL